MLILLETTLAQKMTHQHHKELRVHQPYLCACGYDTKGADKYFYKMVHVAELNFRNLWKDTASPLKYLLFFSRRKKKLKKCIIKRPVSAPM